MGKYRYGAVIDAGSSGSRVYVYNWLEAQAARAKGSGDALARLPNVKTKKKWRKKVHPGISTFGASPELVGPDHLKELVDFALDIVPNDEIANTPIFLLATAGMRLLPDHQRVAVLGHVCSYFRQNTRFLLPDCDLHVQVIPGETEGLYGWVAANYLLGGFDSPEKHDHGKGHSTYGFLDMGGASAQIAFAPNATEADKHANDLKLLRLRRIDGSSLEYRVFVTTWLGYGANEARRRYVQSLLEAYPTNQELPDPCLPVGLLVDQTGHEIASGSPDLRGKQPHLVGTGVFAECLRRTFPLLEKDVPCDDAPCLLHGQHTPAIDFEVNHFVGVSEFWHTTHEVFAMAHKDKAYDFLTYQKQVTDFCSRSWKDIAMDVSKQKWGKKVDEKIVEEVCFKASWLINILHDGIGVPRVGLEPVKEDASLNKTAAIIDKAKDRGFLDPFQAVDTIDDTEVSWTLGKMVLYASSQMPPANNALDVGFGSNVAGTKLPSDFQYASGKQQNSPTNITDGSEQDWRDRVMNGSSSRRMPGLLIFLLVVVLVVYLFRGRERRLVVWSKILSLIGRSPSTPRGKRRKAGGLLGGKLFGNGSPTYERVLEAGDPDDFELGDVPFDERNSGSSNGITPRTGRSSGWATPARSLSPDFSRSSPKNAGYFDATSGSGGGGSGLGITGGIGSRTASKERLAPRDIGRSRAGSPSRRSPLTPFKESLD